MDYQTFRGIVAALGDVWADEEHVYASLHTGFYTAAYLPQYPDTSPEDSTIICRHIDGRWWGYGPHATCVQLAARKDCVTA